MADSRMAAEADKCLMSSEGATWAAAFNPVHWIHEVSGLEGAGRWSGPCRVMDSVTTVEIQC